MLHPGPSDRPNASPQAAELESARTPRNCAHHASDATDSSCHGSRPSRPSSPTVTPLGVHVVIQSVALHPSRPDGRYQNTTADAKGPIGSATFLSGAYTCFHEHAAIWIWDAVGWDRYSPMTFYVDGHRTDHWSAFSNGSISARSFIYACAPGTTHRWTVTGMLSVFGGLGTAAGRFTCR